MFMRLRRTWSLLRAPPSWAEAGRALLARVAIGRVMVIVLRRHNSHNALSKRSDNAVGLLLAATLVVALLGVCNGEKTSFLDFTIPDLKGRQVSMREFNAFPVILRATGQRVWIHKQELPRAAGTVQIFCENVSEF
ncbi:hypothetical protein GQ600_18779 [Phytophthora cactorum]|nr:hypothetical protein GQ600_18779 [Phytophthora cactorum]